MCLGWSLSGNSPVSTSKHNCIIFVKKTAKALMSSPGSNLSLTNLNAHSHAPEPTSLLGPLFSTGMSTHTGIKLFVLLSYLLV